MQLYPSSGYITHYTSNSSLTSGLPILVFTRLTGENRNANVAVFPMQILVRLLFGRFCDKLAKPLYYYIRVPVLCQVAAPRQVPGLAAVDYGHQRFLFSKSPQNILSIVSTAVHCCTLSTTLSSTLSTIHCPLSVMYLYHVYLPWVNALLE